MEFRKLKHEDYDDILDISKDIWGGTDYLPQLFHKWVDDKGIFLGAVDEENNKVVGTAKLSILHDGSGWLEGLRVHKAYRGQKLAKVMTNKLIERAEDELKAGKINKIAFSTHITNIESRTMMEKNNFVIAEAQVLALKSTDMVPNNLSHYDFKVESYFITYEDFKNHEYFKRRSGLFPLAFVFENITYELYEDLTRNNSFVMINGHPGIFKYKGEPNFLALEDTYKAIDTFMNYYLLLYKEQGVEEIYTPVLKEDTELIEKLKLKGYNSWSDWQPDYLYYIYKG